MIDSFLLCLNLKKADSLLTGANTIKTIRFLWNKSNLEHRFWGPNCQHRGLQWSSLQQGGKLCFEGEVASVITKPFTMFLWKGCMSRSFFEFLFFFRGKNAILKIPYKTMLSGYVYFLRLKSGQIVTSKPNARGRTGYNFINLFSRKYCFIANFTIGKYLPRPSCPTYTILAGVHTPHPPTQLPTVEDNDCMRSEHEALNCGRTEGYLLTVISVNDQTHQHLILGKGAFCLIRFQS